MEPSPFVGRGAELAELKHLVARGERLVTVWGPAGMGKTRLAQEWARETGAIFCDASHTTSAEDLTQVVARALGLDAALEKDLASSVALGLGRLAKPLVLVIDNVEQVATDAAQAIDAWLQSAPNATFVVTSRVLLGLSSERALELGPLSGLEASDLFWQLTSRTERRDATAEEASAVDKVVTAIDGIPLAIELASARAGLVGLQQLANDLPQRLELLAGGALDRSDRQKTMRGALEWSFGLLSAREQASLAELTMFPSSFTAAAAAFILGTDSAIEVLDSLRHRSYLRAASGRLSLYGVIRAFAREKLTPAQLQATSGRFVIHWLTAAEAVSSAGDLPSDDVPCLLHAYSLALERRQPDEVERTVRLMHRDEAWLENHVPAHVRASLWDLAVQAAEGHGMLALVALGCLGRGASRLLAGKVDAARDDLDLGARLASTVGIAVEIECLTRLGVLHQQRRDLTAAGLCYQKALSLCGRERGRAKGRLLGNLGAVHHDSLSFDHARRHYEDALRELRLTGDARLSGVFMFNLALLEQEQGEVARALAHFREALDDLVRAGDRRMAAIARSNMGAALQENGLVADACAAHRLSAEELRRHGDVRSECLCLARLCASEAARDDIAAAEAALGEARVLAGALDDWLVYAAIDLTAGFIDLAHARAEPSRADVRLAAVRNRMDRALSDQGRGASASLSDDVRAQLRMLTAEVEAFAQVGVEGSAPDETALCVVGACVRVRIPGHGWEAFDRHQAQRRILQVLVEQHATSTERSVSLDAIQRAAWPGERMRPESAANRIHVALAQLRKRGLRDHIERTADGYRLTPSLRVQRVVRAAVSGDDSS